MIGARSSAALLVACSRCRSPLRHSKLAPCPESVCFFRGTREPAWRSCARDCGSWVMSRADCRDRTAMVGRETEGLRDAAAEMVRLNPDVIVVPGSEATKAMKEATRAMPTVFAGPSYPVEEHCYRVSRGPAATSRESPVTAIG